MATKTDVLTWAQGVIAKYEFAVQEILGLPPANIKFQIGKTGGNSAVTLGDTITLNFDYYSQHMDDAGGIIHEYVHAVQDIQGNNVPTKISEGIADYVRWKLGLTYSGWTPSPIVKQIAKLDTAQVISLANQTSRGNWDNSWLKNPQSIPQSGTTSYITTTSSTSTSQTGSWQYNGPIGDPNAMANPKNWSWTGGGQPTTANPSSYFQGSGSTGDVRKAAFEQVLTSWGIPVDAGLKNLIDNASTNGWSTNQFLQKLYTTPEFHQAFPGIFAANGTLKMSPSQYLANQRSYENYAQRFGVNLSPKQQSYLFQNNVSPSEFGQRAQVLTMLRTNDQYFTAFNQQLKQMGMQPLTKSDQFRFVMGEGNQEWYDVWTRAGARYAGEQAGIKFGGISKAYTNVSQGVVKEVAGLGLTPGQEQAGFAKLAQQLNTTLPMSRIQKMGITKQDLVELEFGGPRQAAVAKKVQQVLLNEKAFLGNRVNMTDLTGELARTPKAGIQQPFAQGP